MHDWVARGLIRYYSTGKHSYLFVQHAAVENEDNWHGKPIPKDRAEGYISELKGLIQTNKPLCPELPTEDAAPVDFSPILLPSLPNYKLGDKVSPVISGAC